MSDKVFSSSNLFDLVALFIKNDFQKELNSAYHGLNFSIEMNDWNLPTNKRHWPTSCLFFLEKLKILHRLDFSGHPTLDLNSTHCMHFMLFTKYTQCLLYL